MRHWQKALAVLMIAAVAGCSSLPGGRGAPVQAGWQPTGIPAGQAATSPAAPVAAQAATPAVPAPAASGAPLRESRPTARPAPTTVQRAAPLPGTPEAGDGLGPLDTVQVEVFGITELNRTTEIDSAGEVQLPLIGRVNVQNLTPDQAARRIERLYAGRYVVNPSVSVRVIQRAARVVSVTGAVTRPGVYPMSGPTSLLQGLALGGGFLETGASDVVRLIRNNGRNDQVLSFDVSAIEQGQASDPWLVSGDRIVVTSAPRQVTVAGFVKTPGVYAFNGRLTLSQAVSLGGGHLPDADVTSVRIIRDLDGRDVTTMHDLQSILSRGAPDPAVLPGDRVVVATLNPAIAVSGAVGEPSLVPWTADLTLSRAIAEAQGIAPAGNERKVAILRVIGGQLQAAQFDLAQINTGAQDDPRLLPGDRIVVGEDRLQALLRDYGGLANIFYLVAIAGSN